MKKTFKFFNAKKQFMKNSYNWQRFFNFEGPKVKYFQIFLSFFPFAYKRFVSFFDEFFIQTEEVIVFFIAFNTTIFRVVTQIVVIPVHELTGKIIEGFENVYNHLLETLIDFPLFNFLIFSTLSLICFGYFVDDAELMLFFSCTLVVLIAGSYINELLDSILEEYSTSIIFSLFEKFSIQVEACAFEKEINTRLKLLDEFLFYSVIFVEQQLSEYTNLQNVLFSYHYSKVVESNIVSDAEELFTKDHLEALTNFLELEKFVITYLIFELLSDEYEISN